MRHCVVGLAWVLVVVCGVVGCGSDAPPPPLDSYFTAQPYSNAACNAVDQRLAGQRHMRLYVNGGSVLPVTQGLASYYHRHSLSFFAAEQPQGAPLPYAVDTNQIALSLALRAAFPNVDLNDEAALMADPVLWNQILTFVANFMLKPMVDFASTHSVDGAAVTNLVVVSQLERPGGMALGDPGTSLAGLAISPALLAEFARTMPDEAQIWQGVDLPAGFTPMMFLGNNVLAQARTIDPVLDDLIAAHEFGHTGALEHTEVSGNLMFPGVTPGLDDCTDGLDDAQLTMMAATYGLGPNAALLAKRAAATPPAAGAPRTISSFGPARLRAMLGGDAQAMRSFVDLLFDHRAAGGAAGRPTAP